MIHKKLITSLLISLFAIFSISCSEAPQETKLSTVPKVVMKTIDVKGMTCENCEGSIVSHITKVDGVVSSKASHIKESVIVKYDESKITIDTIMKSISSLGYKVNGLKEDTVAK